jgi:hypothetical protein
LFRLALGRGPRLAQDSRTLSGRLASAPGPAAWVFLLVAGTFAVNAVALGDREIALAALGPLTVLAWLVTRACVAPAPALSERASSGW